MGRKKTRKKSTKKNKNLDIDLAFIFMIVISILLFVIIYGEKGTIGNILSPILGGIVGPIKYIIPIGFLAMAIAVTREEKSYLLSKIIQYVIFLGCIASILTIYQVSKGALNVENSKFSDALEVAYTLGEKSIGGGTIGAVIAYPLIKLLGMFGAAILSGGAAAALLVFTFGIRPSEIFLNISDKIDEMREEREEELETLRIRREERRKNKIREDESNIHSRRTRMKQENEPESITEDQITINLNNNDVTVDKARGKSIFSKKQEEISESKEQINPNEIESNLFKQEEEKKESRIKEVLQLDHNTIMVEDENYEFPPVELMQQSKGKTMKGGKKILTDTATKLQKTLYSFGVSAKVENVSVGPAITRYELKPAEGVRVSKIAKLSDDIALNLAAESIRIEAPIPGKQAVGIEIPNKEKEIVHLRDIIETVEFEDAKSKLSMALGKNVAGEAVIADISKMPHVLIAGSTGSGKSVCINTLITSIIYKSKPSEVKMVMIDPKVVELSVYNGIPHLLIPVVTDPRKAAGALSWAVQEMENRYRMFAEKGVRDLKGYNETLENEQLEGKMPQIVIIIDELADLMMVAAKDVEDAICRLAQKARAAGMHLVIATQRPSVDVITGIIKANVPSRIAFAVSSQIDSRTILDMAGAEKLLGKGDMLFYPIGASKPVRVQGAFVSDKEVEKIVDFLKSNGEVKYNEDIIESIENANKSDAQKDSEEDEDDADEYLNDAIQSVIEIGQASTSFIQRKFKVGYARAGRIIDQMEARGIISGYEGSKPRKVLMSKERWEELNMMQEPTNNQE
ncbi:MAG: DNA translocase FtsK [Candidatus Scatovivens sp.]